MFFINKHIIYLYLPNVLFTFHSATLFYSDSAIPGYIRDMLILEHSSETNQTV